MPSPITASLLSQDELKTAAMTGAAIDAIGFGKSAQALGALLDAGAKGILYGSVLTGIPVGIMAHMVSRKIQEKRLKERELDKKIEYYRNAAGGIEHGLAGMGVKTSADAVPINYGVAPETGTKLINYDMAKGDLALAKDQAGIAAQHAEQARAESFNGSLNPYVARAQNSERAALNNVSNAQRSMMAARNVDIPPRPQSTFGELTSRVRNAFSANGNQTAANK